MIRLGSWVRYGLLYIGLTKYKIDLYASKERETEGQEGSLSATKARKGWTAGLTDRVHPVAQCAEHSYQNWQARKANEAMEKTEEPEANLN